MKTIIVLFVLLTIFSPNTFAQDIPYTSLEGHTDNVVSVSFSPDGQTLASGSWDDTIRLWDATTGEHVKTLGGYIGLFIAWCLVLMVERSQVAVRTVSTCGMRQPGYTSERSLLVMSIA